MSAALSLPCKLWDGPVHNKGYGRVYRDGRQHYVHRLVYADAHGPIPPGLHIDHLCRQRLCYEITHLEAVTPAENNRRIPWTDERGSRQRARTHCPQGHAYEGANIYYNKFGRKHCRACLAARGAARRAQKKATA